MWNIVANFIQLCRFQGGTFNIVIWKTCAPNWLLTFAQVEANAGLVLNLDMPFSSQSNVTIHRKQCFKSGTQIWLPLWHQTVNCTESYFTAIIMTHNMNINTENSDKNCFITVYFRSLCTKVKYIMYQENSEGITLNFLYGIPENVGHILTKLCSLMWYKADCILQWECIYSHTYSNKCPTMRCDWVNCILNIFY